MTTIVVAGNTMYADSRTNSDGFIQSDNVNKLFKVVPEGWKTPVVIGGAGGYEDLMRFHQWVIEGMEMEGKPDLENFQGLLLTRLNKTKCKVYYFEGGLIPIPSNDKYTAIGSGSAFAYTALDLKATPTQAIKAAMRRDAYTGGKIKSLSV